MAIKMWSNGLNQPDLVDLGGSIVTNYGTLLTNIDADTGDTTYATTYALNTAPYSSTLKPVGLDNGLIYAFMLDYQTKWNALLAAMDLDDGITDVNYVTLCGLGTLVGGSAGTAHHIDPNGMNQGDLLYWLNLVITKMATLTAKLNADGTLHDNTYATDSDITDVIYDSGL
jgi:hypothetical protein